MIIEFFGLPGSGKSTLAHKLSSSGQRMIRINNRIELLWLNLRYSFIHPYQALVGLIWTVKYSGGWKLGYLKFMNLFLGHNAKYMKSRRVKLAIVDQGFITNALSLFESEMSKDVLFSYFRKLPRPDYLIVCDTPAEIRAARLAGRGCGIRKFMPIDYQKKNLQIMEKNYQTVKQLIVESSLPHLIINTDGKVDKLVAEINNYIKNNLVSFNVRD